MNVETSLRELDTPTRIALYLATYDWWAALGAEMVRMDDEVTRLVAPEKVARATQLIKRLSVKRREVASLMDALRVTVAVDDGAPGVWQ